MLDRLNSKPLNPAERAKILNDLAISLSIKGRQINALITMQTAVQTFKTLESESDCNPPGFYSDLAAYITNLALHLSMCGDHEKASEAIEEAMKLYRQLDDEKCNLKEYARYLHVLADNLTALGRPAEALEVIQRAVKVYRGLPQAETIDFATSIDNFACHLFKFGRYEQALEEVEAAIEIYNRPLQAKDNLQFARSLTNLSNILSQLDRHKEALEKIGKAVQLCQQSSNRPTGFKFIFALARSLDQQSRILFDLGNLGEAFKSIEKAVDMYRMLAEKTHPRYNQQLANCLGHLFDVLKKLDSSSWALKVNQEVVQLHRHLERTRPAAFNSLAL